MLAACHDPYTPKNRYSNVYEKDFNFYQRSGADPNANLQREIRGHFRNLRPKEPKKKNTATPSESHHSFINSSTTAKTPKTLISVRTSNSEMSNAFRSRYSTRNNAKAIKTYCSPGQVSGELCDLNTRKNWTTLINPELFQTTEEPLKATAHMNIIKTEISEAGWSVRSAGPALKQKKQQVIMQVAQLESMEDLQAVQDLIRKLKAKRRS